MTEEVKPDDTPEPEVNPVEEQARALGWRPKEEFEAEEKNAGKKWRSADEFMDRKSLFDKIDQVTADNRTLRKGLQSLSDHNAKIEKMAYERALAELKSARTQALQDGDFVQAEEIRDKMDDVKGKIEEVKAAPPVVPAVPPEVIAWKQNNQWYQKDEDMTVYADGLGQRLAANGMPPELVLREVERRVRETFADRFRNPNKDVAPKVEVGIGKRQTTSARFEMTKGEEDIMNNLIRAGAPITKEKYIEDLKKLKGIK